MSSLLNRNSSKSEEFLSPLMYQKEIQRFERKLEWLEQEFHLADQVSPIAVEDLRLDLAKLKHRGNATKAEAKAFRDSIKDTRKYLRQMSKYLEIKQQTLKNVSSKKTPAEEKISSAHNIQAPQMFFAPRQMINKQNIQALPTNPANSISKLTK